ncbi:MAG: DUF624 domain-containing protein [Anaerolineae bacterium]|nr:DUF624 domain-containing protein [Anaerolineae bacterium]
MNPSPRHAGMIAAWEAIAQAVIDVRYVGVTLAYINVLCVLSSVLIVTAPPATAALYVLTREIGYRRPVGWRDFMRALKTYFFVGWRWALLNAAAGGIIFANLIFYSYMDKSIGLPLIGLWLGLTFVWVVVQMYCFPVLLEQARPSVRTALRNAVVLSLRYPLFTLTYALIAGFFVFLSVIVPYLWALITPALLAFFYNRAVYYLVQIEQGKDPELEIEPFNSASPKGSA